MKVYLCILQNLSYISNSDFVKLIPTGIQMNSKNYTNSKSHFLTNNSKTNGALYMIWYQTVKNRILMVGQNIILFSQNELELLHQKSISLNQFAWHSNSHLMFNHSHDINMTLEWHTNRISGNNSNFHQETQLQEHQHPIPAPFF